MSDLYCFVHALGHCFTYNPPTDGIGRFDGGIGLFLGHKDSDIKDLHQHQIYIHERGQFWPNVNLPGIYKIKQTLNKETQLYVQAVKYEKVTVKSLSIQLYQTMVLCLLSLDCQ